MSKMEITAQRVAKELNGEKLYKTVMMKRFGIGFKTAGRVYEIQGYKALTQEECAMLSAEKTRKKAEQCISNQLTAAWI